MVQSGVILLTHANTFQGGVVINGSKVTYDAINGSGPQLLGSVVQVSDPQALVTGALVLNGNGAAASAVFVTNASATYGNDVEVTGATNQLLVLSSLTSGNGSLGTLSFGSLEFGPGNSTLILGNVGGSLPENVTFAFSGTTLEGNADIGQQFTSNATLTTGGISESGGSHSITIESQVTLTVSGASTYSGGTILADGSTVNANSSNALGTGKVTLGNATLSLNTTNAANNDVTGTVVTGTINYNANGAAGGHVVTGGQINIGNSVTSFSNGTGQDSFVTLTNGQIMAPTAALSLLDRGVNFFPGFGTIIENRQGGFPVIADAGTSADLMMGLVFPVSGNISLGVGTPWFGISGGGFIGNITASSNLTLQKTSLGGPVSGTANILAGAGGTSVVVSLNRVTLFTSLADYSGVSKFVVGGNTSSDLFEPNALGGGNSTSPVTMEVTSGSTLQISDPAAINGTVAFDGGSTLLVTSAGVSGTGVITHPNSAMSIDIDNASGLSGTQLTPGFVQANDTLILDANNIPGINSVDPGVHFVLRGTSSQIQEAAGFNVNGGSVLFNGSAFFGYTLAVGPAASGDSTIRVGSNGEAIYLSGNYFPGQLLGGSVNIQVPIISSGAITFSNSTGSGLSGAIVLSSSANQLGVINIPSVYVGATTPGALGGAIINLQGGTLGLQGSGNYANSVTVTQDSDIVVNQNLSASLSTVNLSGAKLTLLPGTSMSIGTLHLTGDATVFMNQYSNSSNMTFMAINEDGSSRSLTFTQNVGGYQYRISGPVTTSGPINFQGAEMQVDGTISTAGASLTISNGGALAGVGTIHRPVVFSDSGGASGTLNPGDVLLPVSSPTTTAATLMVDSLSLSSTTQLLLDLGTPNIAEGAGDDLVVVNGDLTLDGMLTIQQNGGFGPGVYTLMTYGGNLTDDGLILPVAQAGLAYSLDLGTAGQVRLDVSAVPEPGTLAFGIGMVGMMLGRRRRG